MILAERAARRQAEAVAASAKAEAANAKAAEALISYLKLEIEKLRRQIYGTRSERKARLLEQMELQLEELEATATEDELAAEQAAAKTQTVQPFKRTRPSRKPFPEHLPRERVVIPAPESCPCCGSSRLSKLGEDITETLEVIPRQWKVIQTLREKFACRGCETITQPPAPFHVTPRGFAGPNLLAMILFEKFGQHQPLNRQSDRYAREGIDLSLSTLADQVGACAAALQPLHGLIERHVLVAERLHGDDTTVPILAKGQTVKGHIWAYVRDDRPFGGRAPPAALYYASRDRRQEHPTRHLQSFTGILQADAYSGYNELYDASRAQGPVTPALCWAHARRQFFELADIAANARRDKNAAAISPIALEAVKRIDALFDIERGINGQSAEERLRMRKEQSAVLLNALAWLREQRARLSNSSSVAKPIDYMLRRWDRFARFVEDGRICLTNNAAERALRGFALGRKSWLFAGSERGADRAAIMATLIMTAKLNDVDPQAWLADVLARIASTPQGRLNELLPWEWKRTPVQSAA
ncbi:IS66 family transposase [Bradyrhizobium sp. I71]|uniref:IS66 family transposase n=1 Tax=Bradyrhizobium sp. I71 TaxID=2590772 RepID=UPI001EF87D15|nr:IS66 family transposase [Bradyrhizobium sp. I71]ULL01885.1 IS66 family transposase [Bradyrhizobium sp. I71]